MPKVIIRDSDKQCTAEGLPVGALFVDEDGEAFIVTDGEYVVSLLDGTVWDWTVARVVRILNNPTITITED